MEHRYSMPLTRLHVWLALLCAVVNAADVMEVFVGSALSAVFTAAPYHMEPRHLSWLLSAVYLGAVVGAPAIGVAATRYGVTRALIGALCWVTVTSALAACVPADSAAFVVLRFLAGISLGALPPLVVAYLTDISPAGYRGAYILTVYALAALAAPATVYLVRGLTPIEPFGIAGWRWPFALGSVLTLGSAVAFMFAPASVAAARNRFAQSAPLRIGGFVAQDPGSLAQREDRHPGSPPLLATPHYLQRLASAAAIFFLQPWSQAGFVLLTGPILLQRGIELSGALSYVGLLSFGPAIGAVLAGAFLDRWPRRGVLITCALAVLAASIVLFATDDVRFTAVTVVVFGISAGVYLPVMTIYAAESFPARTRASAISSAWGLNRVGSMLVPLVLLPVLRNAGPERVAEYIGGSLVLSIALLAYGLPGLRGSRTQHPGCEA